MLFFHPIHLTKLSPFVAILLISTIKMLKLAQQTGDTLMSKILVLNGPNLNLLGTREPQKYGLQTLEEINTRLQSLTSHSLSFFQSNAEHELIDKIHQAKNQEIDIILINPAAFTHTSIALRDALLATQIPFIEIHLSNTAAREPFRHHSYFSDIAQGVIAGFGPLSYELALHAANHHLSKTKE